MLEAVPREVSMLPFCPKRATKKFRTRGSSRCFCYGNPSVLKMKKREDACLVALNTRGAILIFAENSDHWLNMTANITTPRIVTNTTYVQ